jgi:hypothetical protein
MFALNISATFGNSVDCRINGKPKRVTWRDEHTLVIKPDPYAIAPVDTDKFGAHWTGLEALASQLRGDRTARGISMLQRRACSVRGYHNALTNPEIRDAGTAGD